MFQLTPTLPEDAPAIEALLDAAFGADRKSKTSYRFRAGIEPVAALSHVVRENGRIIGSIAYWPVVAGRRSTPALLLGPLAVDPARKNEGIGAALVFGTLERASQLGHRIVLLVGDPAYYCRFGSSRAATIDIHMPGESLERLQYRTLDESVLGEISGAIQRAEHGQNPCGDSAGRLRSEGANIVR